MMIFVHSTLPVGGAEVLRRITTLELQSRGCDLRLCLVGNGGEVTAEIEASGATVDSLGKNNSIYNPTTTLALAKYFKQHQPTIVQSSQFNSNFHTRIAAKLAGIPVVICEEHGIYHWKHWWHRLADRFLSHWCDKIIAVSQAVKDFNVNNIGIPSSKIIVLHNCIETDRARFIRTREDVRAEFGLTEDDFVIGHVGTLRKEKAHDVLLQAFAEFKQKKSDAKLLLVGDGHLREQLVAQVDQLGLVNDVIFTGTRSDVPDLHKAMDLYVFPSRNEALGIALLEAMYSGLPVVTTKVGGIPEVVKDGETGLLVESEDVEGLAQVIQHLYDTPELRKQLGQNAKEYAASNHGPEAYVDKLQALYSQLLREKGLA
jgi:glycosyltransferase involved in cell wall biosynthesis